MIPKTPPNELDARFQEQQKQQRFEPYFSATKFDITDEMIAKYQKMDSVLNFGIEKVNSCFTSYLMVKTLLEFFFTRYSEVTSSLIHTMS